MAMYETRQSGAEESIRADLARANRELGGVAPLIAHKLESPGQSLVSDAIVARLRGMLEHLALQLVQHSRNDPACVTEQHENIDALTAMLGRDEGIVSHLYALAMEGHLTERLEKRVSLDPVLSPLLQSLIASSRSAIAELAMETLAAQSRFVQGQRRMQLLISELPAELFAGLLNDFGAASNVPGNEGIRDGIEALRRSYDESTTRLGLLARLVSAMEDDPVAALELWQAGLALFASGMAASSGQPRDIVILACHERQAVRLALGLRAAGQEVEAIDRQLLMLDPSEWDPAGVGALAPERAASLLESSLSPPRIDG